MLGKRSKDDKRQVNRWKKIVRRFRGKLVKMIKYASSKCDDYSPSPKIRQILLHWGYELTEKGFQWVEKLMYKIEGLKRSNNSVTYDRGVL